jgi:hypothetical protein
MHYGGRLVKRGCGGQQIPILAAAPGSRRSSFWSRDRPERCPYTKAQPLVILLSGTNCGRRGRKAAAAVLQNDLLALENDAIRIWRYAHYRQ